MSNQIGLILSFFFLAILISFSFELINFQQSNALFINEVYEVANYIEKNGYDNTYIADAKENYEMKILTVNYEMVDGLMQYTIVASKNVDVISKNFEYLNNDMSCTVKVYRKE